MKYFLDTEFIESPQEGLDLISLGIISEDNRELYLVNLDCDFTKADDWVLANVLTPIGLTREGFNRPSASLRDSNYLETLKHAYFKSAFSEKIQEFCNPTKYGPPEFWAYYSDYDWVVFCQIFGKMIDLPAGFPMYCRDLKQEADRLQVDLSVIPNPQEHNALEDAKWNKTAFNYVQAHDSSRKSVKELRKRAERVYLLCDSTTAALREDLSRELLENYWSTYHLILDITTDSVKILKSADENGLVWEDCFKW